VEEARKKSITVEFGCAHVQNDTLLNQVDDSETVLIAVSESVQTKDDIKPNQNRNKNLVSKYEKCESDVTRRRLLSKKNRNQFELNQNKKTEKFDKKKKN
jgi:Skp family chaperone for outer membrane proteins